MDFVANKTGLVVNQDLFAGDVPVGQEGVAVWQDAGAVDFSGMERYTFHFVAIYKDYSTAEEKCNLIYTNLGFRYRTEFLDATKLFAIYPVIPPFYQGRDNIDGYYMFVTTFEVVTGKEFSYGG